MTHLKILILLTLPFTACLSTTVSFEKEVEDYVFRRVERYPIFNTDIPFCAELTGLSRGNYKIAERKFESVLTKLRHALTKAGIVGNRHVNNQRNMPDGRNIYGDAIELTVLTNIRDIEHSLKQVKRYWSISGKCIIFVITPESVSKGKWEEIIYTPFE
jgi:hypothetical protein